MNEGLRKSIVDWAVGLHKSTVFPLWLEDDWLEDDVRWISGEVVEVEVLVLVHPSVSVVDGMDVDDISDMGVDMGVEEWFGKVSCNWII